MNYPAIARRNGTKSLDTFIDSFFNNDLGTIVGRDSHISTPSVNIGENVDNYWIEMAAPGYSKDQFVVNIDNDKLTISAEVENKTEDIEDKSTYSRREFKFASFSRSFNLPDTIDSDKIMANYNNGILTLTLPKREEVKPKPARQIKIK